jgi:hypothetical protein
MIVIFFRNVPAGRSETITELFGRGFSFILLRDIGLNQ